MRKWQRSSTPAPSATSPAAPTLAAILNDTGTYKAPCIP